MIRQRGSKKQTKYSKEEVKESCFSDFYRHGNIINSANHYYMFNLTAKRWNQYIERQQSQRALYLLKKH